MKEVNNPLKTISDKYKQLIPNPLMQASVLLALGLPIAYYGKKAIKKQIRDLAGDPRTQALMGVNDKQTNQALNQMQNNWLTQHGLPIAIGSIPALVSLGLNFKSDHPGYGLTKWPDMYKKASMWQTPGWQTPGYQPQLDFSRSINVLDTKQMMASNPYLQDSSYARNLGTSIVSAAPAFGNTTTLGNIYDSAYDKFDKKLSFQSTGSKIINGAIAGSLAGMFTDVVGTVMGVPDPLRTRMANSIGVGKALYDILT